MANPNIDSKSVIIYGLSDPITNHLRYIGKTSGGIRQRGLAHISDVRRGRTYIPRHRWISSLISKGMVPEIFEIEVVPISEWREAEQFWIAYFRFIGCDLLNATSGGDGLCSYRHTEETRSKQAAAAKQRYLRDGEREKTSAAVRTGQSNTAYREKIMAANANLTDEARKRMSDAAKIHRNTPKAKAAMVALMTGKPRTAAQKLAISKANKGRKRSPESVAKQVERMRGFRHSAETRAKIAASQNREERARATKNNWGDPEYRAKQAQVDRRAMLKAFWADPIKRAARLAQNAAARLKRNGSLA